MPALLAALTWEPQVKGALYVLIAFLVLPGSCYLLLATNMGARLGFQLAAAGLLGFLVIIGFVWWIYGIGPKGSDPSWEREAVVTGDLATTGPEAARGFPKDWKKLEIADPAVLDAEPVVAGELTADNGPFESADDFVLVGAFEKGGEDYGPFGLDFRPFDVFHKAHYLTVQVQHVVPPPEPVPGQPPPRPQADPQAPVVSVVLLRNLGSLRLNPALFTLGVLAGFLLFCYSLHQRDKEAAARRAAQ